MDIGYARETDPATSKANAGVVAVNTPNSLVSAYRLIRMYPGHSQRWFDTYHGVRGDRGLTKQFANLKRINAVRVEEGKGEIDSSASVELYYPNGWWDDQALIDALNTWRNSPAQKMVRKVTTLLRKGEYYRALQNLETFCR